MSTKSRRATCRSCAGWRPPAKGPSTFTVDSGSGRADAGVGPRHLRAAAACLPSLAPDTSLWGRCPTASTPSRGAAGSVPARATRRTGAADGARPGLGGVGCGLPAQRHLRGRPHRRGERHRRSPGDEPDGPAAPRRGARTLRHDHLGHSPGGHAAVWAGQMMDSYQERSAQPRRRHPAAGGVRVGAGRQLHRPARTVRGIEAGNGLADWEMHHDRDAGPASPPSSCRQPPPLFSYIFGSWLVGRGTPQMTRPPGVSPRRRSARFGRVTAEGAETVASWPHCARSPTREGPVDRGAVPRLPPVTRCWSPSCGTCPTPTPRAEFFKGGVDRACATRDPERSDGSAWATGAVDPLEPARTRRGQPVPEGPRAGRRACPCLIGQGMTTRSSTADPADGRRT